ncbi:MAG: hypothetical protein EZS28_005980 [Streblomastix strix]|uniref:Uncharacterized protein n=1 Tax=Streblomastix strix TaxID=222440 RepID=A0A5J4WU61_9EUKA|nr:MAG: hypothetical protein EZS28_005980 [Streblomastix strix]
MAITKVLMESACPSVEEPYPKRLINRISHLDVMEATKIVLKGAGASWKENTYLNNLENTNIHKKMVMNYVENQKFKEELRIELELGVIKQVPENKITHFNPTNVSPKKRTK